MSKLVVESSQVNWPLESIPKDLRRSCKYSDSNPEDQCKVRKFIDGTLKDNQAWRKHLNFECWCSVCNCGKHMCKLHRLKPMGKHLLSNYKINYKKHPRMHTTPTKFAQQFSPSKGVISESTYHADFQPKESPNKNMKSETSNNLMIGGPFFVGTTYKQQYYPKISANIGQITMPDSNIFAMNIPMNAKSSYSDNYRHHPNIATESFKPTARYKKSASLDYVKGTTYNANFKLPSLDAYNHKVLMTKMKTQSDIDHINKKSTYQAEFVVNSLNLCPAITEMKKKTIDFPK